MDQDPSRDRGADTESQPFEHSSTSQRAIAWISQNLFDRITYTSRRGLTAGLKRKGGLGWLPGSASDDTPEERFWKSFDIGGKVAYDVGAFQGLFTIFLATRARHVVAYEPNTRSARKVRENLHVNRLTNVTVRDVALGAEAEDAVLVYSPLTPGMAHVGVANGALAGGARSERIHITTLDADIRQNKLPKPDLIKMDIEGFELAALQGARETLLDGHPELVMEMHGSTLREKREKTCAIVNYVEALGYSRITHVESDRKISGANCESAPEGHLYCRR